MTLVLDRKLGQTPDALLFTCEPPGEHGLGVSSSCLAELASQSRIVVDGYDGFGGWDKGPALSECNLLDAPDGIPMCDHAQQEIIIRRRDLDSNIRQDVVLGTGGGGGRCRGG